MSKLGLHGISNLLVTFIIFVRFEYQSGDKNLFLIFPVQIFVKTAALAASFTLCKQDLELPDGEGNGNPLQCSCLENPRVGGAW